MTLQLIVFIVLALFIAVCSVLAVTTSRILRVRFIWYSRYLLPAQLLILGSCTITDLRRWYNSALCI